MIGLLAGVLIAVPVQAAQAFGIKTWNAGVYSHDYTGPDPNCTQAGYCYTQSGGHPFVGVTDFTVDTTNGGTVKQIRVDVPPGLISNPQAITQCTDAQFPSCPSNTQPSNTQIGIEKLSASLAGITTYIQASVYNMVPKPGQVSDFAFNVPLVGRVDIVGFDRRPTTGSTSRSPSRLRRSCSARR
jgi:hypothetical protein